MAKPATLQIKLVSTADTGYFYVTKKNPRTKPEKLEVRKYDRGAQARSVPRSQDQIGTGVTRPMIGLALDADSATAAIQPDGGDFDFGQTATMPDGGYREWLTAVPDILASVSGIEAATPVAVAIPGIVQDGIVKFTPVQHLEGRDLRRDLQSVLSREIWVTSFGAAFAAWHATSTDDNAPIAALWIGPAVTAALP